MGESTPLRLWFQKRAATIGSVALLGLCELIFVAAASNYIAMRSAGVSLLFGAATLFIAALTLAALYVGSLKDREDGRGIAGNAKSGAALGAAAGAIVCAITIVFSAAGFGPERALERAGMQAEMLQAVLSYVSLLIRIFLIYLAAGAVAGVAAHFFPWKNRAGFFSARKAPVMAFRPAVLPKKRGR